jgi:CHAD domain-containing protein
MVQAALAHALPNLAEIADGTSEPEHLHQLRVGLRRLRTVLRECAPWSGDAAAARRLEADWRAPFARLGAARDLDALSASLGPALAALGAPPLAALPQPGPAAEPPGQIVRSVEFQCLLLRTLALPMPSAGTPAEALSPAAAALLQRAWRRALADVDHFARARPTEQHLARKRLKRLRYAFEFLMPLYPSKSARGLQRALAAAGEALGELNDLAVASAAYRALCEQEPRAWLALGWLAERREGAVRESARRLRRLAGTPRPWSKVHRQARKSRRPAR